MSDQAALAAFLDKWRARWPEWRIAEVFVPAPQRGATLAWLALRQELADAAWQGADPRPGAAKLAWWGEELQGWSHGRRRHPLGLALQRVPAPWGVLAAALPALAAGREAPMPAGDGGEALRAVLAPFTEAAAAVSAAIDGDAGTGHAALAAGLCAARVLAGEGAAGATEALLDAWPSRPAGTRADRIFAALARQRLQAPGAGAGGHGRMPSQWRTLWTAWRAGRSVPQA